MEILQIGEKWLKWLKWWNDGILVDMVELWWKWYDSGNIIATIEYNPIQMVVLLVWDGLVGESGGFWWKFGNGGMVGMVKFCIW